MPRIPYFQTGALAFHAIPARTFGSIQGLIGSSHDLVEGGITGIVAGHADTLCNLNLLLVAIVGSASLGLVVLATIIAPHGEISIRYLLP